MKPEESSSSSTMQDAFGCVVENRFLQLLDDESDPLDFLQQASSDRGHKKKKEEADAKKASKQKSSKKESQKDRKINAAITEAPALNQSLKQSVQKVTPYENSSAEVSEEDRSEYRSSFREFRTDVFYKPTMYSVDNIKFEKERLVRNWVANHRGGIRGGGRGFPRYMENENQKGKREFERHSGSDRARIRAEDKRGGGGPHNWGSFQDAFSDAEPVPVEPTEPVDATCEAIDEQDSKGAYENYEDYAKEMTLDEWKSILDQSRPKIEFNLRKPDSKVPAKATVIHKSKFKNNLKGDEENNYSFRKPVNDITSQLDINFGSLARPARGGRGRGRGRFGREEAFPHDVSNVPELDLNPDDPDAFPALI